MDSANHAFFNRNQRQYCQLFLDHGICLKNISASEVVTRIAITNRNFKVSENVLCMMFSKKNCRKLAVYLLILKSSFINNFKFSFLIIIWAQLDCAQCKLMTSVPPPTSFCGWSNRVPLISSEHMLRLRVVRNFLANIFLLSSSSHLSALGDDIWWNTLFGSPFS